MENRTKTFFSNLPKQSIRLNKFNFSSRGNFIPPADPLIERKIVPLKPPKFVKNYSIINIPPFYNNNKNEIEEEFTLEKKEKIKIPFQEYVLDLYINSTKMLKKLVYYKENYIKEEKVTIENFINIKEYEKEKKKNKKRNKTQEKKVENIIIENGFDINETIIFESKFESGNLQLAYLTEQSKDEENIDQIDKYQLFLHNDTNTTGYTQWFFFRVKNMKKGKTVNFSIMNMLRKRTKYCYGIKIWVYTKLTNINEKKTWHHTKEEVKYYKNNLYRLHKGNRQYYYTLSFDYTSKYDNDEIYFANCIPFTYTDLINDLNYYTKNENIKYPFFHRKTLCQTIGGNDIEYITINNSKYENNDNKKKGIILIARQHPSETVGSWKIKGAIDFLLGESDEAKFLRDNFIFKIIPMINVDGVINGNTRTSIAGCDLNRRWVNPNEFLHPEIYFSKDLIYNFANKINIECIIDFHGHFGAFNSFFYGNFDKDNFTFCKYFPFICSQINDIISFQKSQFQMPKFKKGTGRIHLFEELNIENIFTLETSYFGCVNGKYSNQYLTVEKLQNIGRDICVGFLYLFYHNNKNNVFMNLSLNNYPKLKSVVEKKYEEINNEFNMFIEKKNNNINNKEKNEDKNEEDDDNLSSNESNSESEPSDDNIDIEELKKLIPFGTKKKKFKKRKSDKTMYLNGKKNSIYGEMSLIENTNYNTTSRMLQNNANSINLPKISNSSVDSKQNENTILKRQVLLSGNYKKKILNISVNIPSQIQNVYNKNYINNKKNLNNNEVIIMVNSFTQTEELFFKMHWTYFIGSYNIITPRYQANNNSNPVTLITDYRYEKSQNKVIKTTTKNYNITRPKSKTKSKNKIESGFLMKNVYNLNNNDNNYTYKSLSNAFKINKSPFQILGYNNLNNIKSFDLGYIIKK